MTSRWPSSAFAAPIFAAVSSSVAPKYSSGSGSWIAVSRAFRARPPSVSVAIPHLLDRLDRSLAPDGASGCHLILTTTTSEAADFLLLFFPRVLSLVLYMGQLGCNNRAGGRV